MNGNELGLLIALIILLLIAFFLLGFLYARMHYVRILGRMMQRNRVRMHEIKIENEDDFNNFMKSLFDNEENENDDTRNDS